MMRYYFLRPDSFRTAAALGLVWVVFVLLFDNGWTKTYNAASVALWMPMIWLGGLVAATSAASTVRARAAARAPVSQPSPRGRLRLELLRLLSDVVFFAALPYAMVAGTVLAGAYLGAGQGRLDLNYLWLTLLYCGVLVLVGRIVAQLVAGPMLAPVFAFVAALFFGLYSILTVGEIDVWSAFDPFGYVLVGGLAIVALAAVSAVSGPPRARDRAIAAVGLVTMAALVWVIGPVDMSTLSRTAGEDDSVCLRVERDQVCVWSDDVYKIGALSEQVRRMRRLATAAGLEIVPSIFAEPGVVVDPVLAQESFEVRSIYPLGGAERSWPAAQTVAAAMFESPCPLDPDDIEGAESGWLLQDIATNFVYGDIDYSGFASSLPQVDARRADLASSAAGWSEDEQLAWLVTMVQDHRALCARSGGNQP